ncbi:MAG: divergent polysaccharide deacetylase family protein [Candidatus Acidiferrales bacterium]
MARPRVAAPVALAIALVLSGCAKKSLTTAQLRSITREIVAAAQDATQRKSEITIRPEVQLSAVPGQPPLTYDAIYVSPADSSQTDALRQSFAEIARRHDLSITEVSSSSGVRFDLAFHGNRTHSILVAAPLAASSRRPFVPAGGNPQLAIIVDDLGHDRASADSLLALPFPLTISVIPHLPFSAEVADAVYRRGDQVILHMPMQSEAEGEPSEGVTPESIELRVGMSPEQVESELSGMLATVPHAAGVNNHQGSRATADPALMATLMPDLRERGLFFIDSRTTAATVAYAAAERSGVRAASRKVFLDDTPTREAVLAQLDLAARDAIRDGSAIAIGHPHPGTIAALAEEVPRLEARGIRIVFASDLAH